ncbi:FAD-dependent oxidoreductase [Parahaliea sp. F7430]|uniref:FAD-dependent oxidoreductase n=1 Tax=Sediminihaliea albiluteola TaxID=2758564 RepID=A0A7W2TXH9_9GAMM|nr:FAD-dependent oxidoreductase [Sediminihaliea albiluteola]MBA6413770.1 FAD-dependent oxidoreductase [Sediminihaliea albiluteola]
MTGSENSIDVMVVGGGVAGLCAAIAAHDQGAKVMLVEAADQLGGTASWSGGALWVPANHHLAAAGGEDSRDAALAYMRHCSQGRSKDSLLAAYLDAAPEVVRYLEDNTPLRFEVGIMPDYEGGIEGGFYTPGLSRSLAPHVFNINRLGDQQKLLRRSPHGTVPFGYQEYAQMNATIHPERIDPVEYQRRLEAGDLGWGEALCAALLLGVLERDIQISTETRLSEARPSDTGYDVTLDSQARGQSELAVRNLILCCGGYEWDSELMEKNFPRANVQPATVPDNLGTAWKLAEQLGAQIGNESTCWGWPAYKIPGETLADGNDLIRSGLVERALPHMVLINAKGRRFVDESLPYHAILKAMVELDSDGYSCPNLPAFHVFDQQFRDKYSFGPIAPGMPTPDWMLQAESLEELAAKAGIDAASLVSTIERFNQDVAERGKDSEFHRGTSSYGLFWGDPDNQPAPNLGCVNKGPFYAVPMFPSTIGTCGGPVTDEHARVLDSEGKAMPGLYAAGNSTAAFSGPSYFGPGGTIGPAMIFGVVAARHAGKRLQGEAS